MERLASSFKTIHFAEIVLMLSVFMGLIVKFVFHYQANFFIEIFAIGLALVYFPFGFYFIKKPSENYTHTTSVVLGFIYSLGIITILISAVNVDSYRYPLILDFSVLLALIIYLIIQLRKDDFHCTYVNTQFIRVAFIMICSIFILLK